MISHKLFAEELRYRSGDIRYKILNHKFIFEIGTDILPTSKFIFYLEQDRIFLKEFCNLLKEARRIAKHKQTAEWFEILINSTVRFEMKMQCELLDSLRLNSGSKSLNVSPANTTLEYISFMKRTSVANNLNTLVSAMAPCPWTYYEIAQKLAKVNVRTPVYKKWVRFYSSEESRRQVNEVKELLNKLSTQVDDEQKVIMKDHFATACNYELQFWNMAYSTID